jgi:hypothetical protein
MPDSLQSSERPHKIPQAVKQMTAQTMKQETHEVIDVRIIIASNETIKGIRGITLYILIRNGIESMSR